MVALSVLDGGGAQASPLIPRELINVIDEAIQADGGARYRTLLRAAMHQAEDPFRPHEEKPFRAHLGASILGGECARWVWYEFHWATVPSFSGRILRLFNRGHLEEPRFIALLQMLGAEVFQLDKGKQFKVEFADGHGGGSLDGVARNIPYIEGVRLCEFKTHGESSFITLAGNLPDWRKYLAGAPVFPGDGVRKAHFTHYVQMQIYMNEMQLTAALYIAVCKNTDDIYIEEVPYDRETALQFIDRASELVSLLQPPPKINSSPGFYKCKLCNQNAVCHQDKRPARNCRTCANVMPGAAGTWGCRRHRKQLSTAEQHEGCSEYTKQAGYGDVPF